MNLKWLVKSNDGRPRLNRHHPAAVTTTSITAATIAATIASAGIAAAVIPGMAVTTEPAVIAAFAAGIAGRAVIS